MNVHRTSFFGCPMDRITPAELLQHATAALAGNRPFLIEGVNVAKLIATRSDLTLKNALHEADIVHVDGAGIHLAARLLGKALPPRQAGVDVMMELLQLAAASGAGVYLLGAQPEIVTRAATKLQQQFPSLILSGTQHGYFAAEDAPKIAATIAASGAKLLLVGMSSPKKELFLQQHKQACGVTLAMGVGGAFDILAGTIARAPLWMQRHGLEWVFRLLQEPRRLAWRYFSTNSQFAWLVLRGWITSTERDAKNFSWASFLEILQQHCPEALAYRHELYFLHQQRTGSVRAVLALIRDAWMLLRSQPLAMTSPATVLAVATLAGASGYGALKRALDPLLQERVCLIAHPRMKGTPARMPARISFQALQQAWREGRKYLHARDLPFNRVIIASCAARHALWCASWRTFHQAHPQLTHTIMHNDFDMMSSACVKALGNQVTTVCVQHGIPTDEFFPARATLQIVWGETSKAAYDAQGSALMVDALGRSTPAQNTDASPPTHVLLLSQTHTVIYQLALAPYFEALADQLMAVVPLRVLLHPQETMRAGLYASLPHTHMDRPPHAALQAGARSQLVVGYCSTALLEAAQAGHYVVAMDWPMPASHAAKIVCDPPVRCQTAAELVGLFQRLQESQVVREAHQQQQQAWLARSFSESGEWSRYAAAL